MKKLLLVLLLSLPLYAQNSNGTATDIRKGAALPQTCGAGQLFYKTTPPIGAHQCINGAWVYISGGTGTNGTDGTNGQDGAPGAPGYSPNQITSGCGVGYLSGLTFNISACNYIIGNLPYSAVAGQVTGPAADPSLPRIDAIVVNRAGTFSVVAGEAAASPAKPSLDVSNQLELTFYTVAAGATTPDSIVTVDLYHENAEWTCAVSANLNCASTVNPHAGTKDIEATTATTGNYARLTIPAGSIDLAESRDLVFWISPKAAFATRSITLQWFNGTTAKCTPVSLFDNQFVFNSGSTAYQQIVVPLSVFNCSGIPVTRLQFTVAGTGGTMGFYLDDVYLQGGIGANTGNSGMQWLRVWNSTTLYKIQDTVTRNGTTYTAIAQNTNQAPESNPLVWDAHDTHQPAGVDGNIQIKAGNTFGAINSAYDPATQRVTFPGDVYATSLVATGTTNQSLTLVAATSPSLSASGEISIISNAGTCQISQNGGAYADCATVFGGTPVTTVSGTSPIVSSGGTTPAISCPTCVVASAPGAGVAHFAGSTQTVTSSPIATADIAANAVTSAKEAVVNTRRTCMLQVGDGTNTVASGDYSPFKAGACYVPYAATIVEINIQSDAGTPSVVLERRRGAATLADLLSGALAAAGTTHTCAMASTGQTCIDGTTSSGSITLSNTSLSAGDVIEVKSGTASTETSMRIAVVFTVN